MEIKFNKDAKDVIRNVNTIAKMVEQLKTKTENDEDVDNAYDLYPDWP